MKNQQDIDPPKDKKKTHKVQSMDETISTVKHNKKMKADKPSKDDKQSAQDKNQDQDKKHNEDKKSKAGKKDKGNKKSQGLDPRITNREFKLLLKPEGLDRRIKITQLQSLIVSFCQKNDVSFFHLDNANTGLRNVYFFDTPGEHFRRNNLILRVRESRQNVWVDDWCEVTLKCRTPDLKSSLKYDPKPNTLHKHRLRLKEEILRGDQLGSSRRIYSNNSIMDAVPIDQVFERSFGSVKKNFPDLARLGLEHELPVRVVGGRTNKILEACLPIGNLSFGDGVQAHCDIGIWMRSVGEPIIGELAYSYRVTDANRSDSKAHKRADKFFENLQLAIPDWLATGSTKTALIYGIPE